MNAKRINKYLTFLISLLCVGGVSSCFSSYHTHYYLTRLTKSIVSFEEAFPGSYSSLSFQRKKALVNIALGMGPYKVA